MDLEKSRERPGGEGCLVVALRMPVRIVVLVLVVPVRMVWDALVVAGRFLGDTVFRPVGRALAWMGRAVFVWPFVALWRWVLVPLGTALRWLGMVLVVVPAGWLYRWVLTPLGHGIAACAAAVRDALAWLGHRLLVVPSVWLYRWVFTPVGHALAWCGRGLFALGALLVAGIGAALCWTVRVLVVWPACAVWRWVLAPVGRVLGVVAREAGAALGHAWRVAGYVSLAVGRVFAALVRWTVVEPARRLYRTVLTPVGHAVRDAVLRPVAEAARGAGRVARETLRLVRATARQARQDVRRALLGDPGTAGEQGDREVKGARAASGAYEDGMPGASWGTGTRGKRSRRPVTPGDRRPHGHVP
ncbi:hypothetical protein ACH3WN_02120 [Streptomyces albogriseolus]|uniref:hypothetical protein n=1 Tax=Streptomyces albogriseolus TaxID=1887 RepID=UPI00379638D4